MVEARPVQRTAGTFTGRIMKPKIVVQNRSTKHYLTGKDQWTKSSTLAREFETSYHALHFCVSEEIDGLDIVFRLPNDREVCFLRC